MITHVHRFEERIEQTEQHLGWQVLVTSLDADTLDSTDAVPLYNEGWKIEMQIRDVNDRPLGIRPLHATRDDQITGLTYVITLGRDRAVPGARTVMPHTDDGRTIPLPVRAAATRSGRSSSRSVTCRTTSTRTFER